MSHFVAMVLLAGDTNPCGVDDAVRASLARYSEELDVPAYDRACYCVGSKARSEASDHAALTVGTVDDIHKQYAADPVARVLIERQHALEWSKTKLTPEGKAELKAIGKETSARWKIAIAPYVAAEASALARNPDAGKADPDCGECHGAGTYSTTSNPHGKWNWWVIGGRWAGWIRGSEDDMPDDVNMFVDLAASHKARAVRNAVRSNTRHVSEFPVPLPEELIPFALVTPDGEWHERGKMGWFGQASNESENWPDTVRGLIAKYPTSLAVAVDLHV